jgi:2-keto-3-deoxy-L-rhamnonate aldolase RhmA
VQIYPNHAKHHLAAGGLAIGMGVRQARTIDIAAIAKTSGYDWLFIDMEHSALDLDTATQIAAAALPLAITPIVRVPGKEHYHASRVLDCGAQGVVVPHVDTAEEVERVVSHCRYPPAGRRSVAGGQPQFGFRSVPVGEMTRLANEETLVVVMLESPGAIERSDAIAAVPGIDVLLIGTNDLTTEMGMPGQLAGPHVEEAYRTVIAACRKHGKVPGMGGVYDPKLLERYVALGMRFILAGNDLTFLAAGARERASFVRGLERR